MNTRRLAILLPLLAAACDAGPVLAPPAADPAAATLPAPLVDEGHLPGEGGVDLFYRVHGRGPDTVLVVTGGPGLSSAYLSENLDRLERGRTVVYFDGRGAGRSELLADPARLTFGLHVADVEAVRRYFGLERFRLVGHSWGALVAAGYAAAHPERVERLALLTPGPVDRSFDAAFDSVVASRLGPDGLPRLHRRIALLASGAAEEPRAECEEIFDALFAATQHEPESIARMRGGWCDGPVEASVAAFATLGAGRASLGDWDLRPMLATIQAPTLVVHGASDAIVLASSAAYAGAVPGARLEVIERTGHFPWLERPEVFFPLVNRFLRR